LKDLTLSRVAVHDSTQAPVEHPPRCFDEWAIPFTSELVQLLALRMLDKQIDPRPLVAGT
jgi:hypothetical protein